MLWFVGLVITFALFVIFSSSILGMKKDKEFKKKRNRNLIFAILFYIITILFFVLFLKEINV